MYQIKVLKTDMIIMMGQYWPIIYHSMMDATQKMNYITPPSEEQSLKNDTLI